MQSSHLSSKSWSVLPRLLLRRETFTAQEVRQRLQIDTPRDQRTEAVHTAAAHASLWSDQVPDRLRYELGRTATRLPSVVFWYRQGVPMHEIGRRLSPFGNAWDADRALQAAAALIAQLLNRGQPLFIH
jgi:hypothetical protein